MSVVVAPGSPGATQRIARHASPSSARVSVSFVRTARLKPAIGSHTLPDETRRRPGLPARLGLEDGRNSVEVVAKVAARREVWRPAGSVVAVSGIGLVETNASSSRALSSASREKLKTFRLSWRCSLSRSRAPMMAAATASCSRTQRVATLEMERHVRPISRAALRTSWNAGQPPATSMKRLHFQRLQSGIRTAPACPATYLRESRRTACHRPAA